MANLDIGKLRELEPSVICVGSHKGIIQSVMDFDYLQGRKQPSIKAIIASGRNSERFFFGKKEVLLPVHSSVESINPELKEEINLFINLVSGRRVLS